MSSLVICNPDNSGRFQSRFTARADALMAIPDSQWTDADEKFRQRWHELKSARGVRYAKCTFDNYENSPEREAAVNRLTDVCRDMTELRAVPNILIYGPAGTGKDHLAMACMREALAFDHRVMWVSGLRIWERFRDAISSDERESSVIREYTHPAVLCISDPLPPSGPLTDFQMNALFRILDERYSDCNPTWVTINVASSAEMDSRMGVQNADRLRDGAVTIFTNWKSYRETSGQREASQ